MSRLGTACLASTLLVDTYGGIADRLVFYNALMGHPDRLERFGEVARRIHFLSAT